MEELIITPHADGSLTLSRCVLEAGRAYRLTGVYGRAAGALALYTQAGRLLAESREGSISLDTEAIRALTARRPLGYRAPCVAWYDDGAAYRCPVDVRAAPQNRE